MSTRIDVDGFIDGVDFDTNDKLALDGQRLILVTGTYWADGSTYATEVQSNAKIELIGTGTTMHFIVSQPDGSRSWYGNYGGMNATDLTAFYITRFEDTNGNFITYHYTKPLNKSLCVDEIKFSANINGVTTPQNRIKFNYVEAKRFESGYLKGERYEKAELLNKIQVYTNALLFREYRLTHIHDTQLGYERVSQLQEFNGALEPANPVVFNYNTTITTNNISTESQTNYVNNLNFNEIKLAGDFDGDGRLDFTTDEGLYRNLFNGSSGQAPITLPYVNTRNTFVATTLDSNGKLNQSQSIVYAIETQSSISFNMNNLEGNSITQTNQKIINFNNKGEVLNCTNYGPLNGPYYYTKDSNLYYEGDFNGDGTSDVLILSTINEKKSNGYNPYTGNCTQFGIINSGLKYSIVNLNQISSSNQPTVNDIYNSYLTGDNINYGNINSPYVSNNLRYISDFNGDGKSDLMLINSNKDYKIVTFNFSENPAFLEIIGQGTIDKYTTTKQILFGDYNGDGKTDIMLPDTEGGSNHTLWHIYYANPQPTGGSFFVKESHNICEYWPNTGNHFNTQTHFSNYYALDANGDGKTDLVRVWRMYYKPPWTINNHDTKWKVFSYVNNIGNKLIPTNVSKFTLDYESATDHDSGSPDLVVPIASNYKVHNINNDLVLVHNHYNRVFYINFKKDVAKDIRISSINSSYGGFIVDNIDYSPMEPGDHIIGGLGLLFGFYSSLNSVNYPFVEIKKLSNNYLVSSIRNTVDGITRRQNFSYNGLVVNLHGLGSIGFNKVVRSNWYPLSYTGKKLWSVTENRHDLRGATERKYTTFTTNNQAFSFLSTNLAPIPNAITSTTNVFSATTVNGIYKFKLETQTTKDFLTNVSSETSYTYDTEGYLLPSVVTTKNFITSPTSPVGTTTVTTTFANNPTGTGANYYIGRPTEINTVTTAYSDTFSSKEKLTYTGNKLTKTEKRGNTTSNNYLVEDFEYFPIGNIKKKTIYTTGYTGQKVIMPRATEFTYDTSERFIKTSKDVEGLISTNVSYHPLYGEVTQSQNPYGLTTTTLIDNWGKVTKITDYLGKNTTIAYSKIGSDSRTFKTGDDGSASMNISDILGRTKKTGVLNIDNNWSYKTIEYDVFGRKYRESEPHYEIDSPIQWTTYSYDDYSRQTAIVNHTGLNTTISYSGLTITGTDGVKTTSSTKNANGHVVSSTDNGGTITYQYYANGTVKSSNYSGTTIQMQYDEWGRKSLLNDPSAGIYTYSYNPLGEVLVETTPNGTTTSNYNNVGKITTKNVTGLNTNDFIEYEYDPVSKLLYLDGNTDISGNASNNEYFYDAQKRLIKTVESYSENSVIYEKRYEYDAFGRIYKEYNSASLGTKSSAKWLRHTYKNGYKWQILDDASNQLLWQNNTVNERGQLTGATYGNGIAVNNTYDYYGYPYQIKHDKTTPTTANVMTLNTTFEPLRGNLTNRNDNLFYWNENFEYDTLDRLKKYNNALGIQVDQTYEIDGRIKTNTLGTYNYSNSAKKYQNTSVDVNSASKAYYENRLGLFNDSMEVPNTWAIYEPTVITYDTTTANVRSGNSSLKIANTTAGEKVVHSNYWVKIDNSVPTQYTYSTWVKSDGTNPQAEIFLFMKTETETGYATLVDQKVATTTGAWTLIEKTFLVPATIKRLGIRLDNNAIGNLWFDDVRIRKTNDTSTERKLNISYTAHKSPYEIEETGNDKISFTYNINNSRCAMYYGGLQADKYQRQFRKYYSVEGSMEIKHNTQTGEVEFVTYIGGDGYTAPVVLKSNGTTQQYLYLHRDYLGSIVAITNQSGAIVEKRQFDAWGELIKIQDGQNNILNSLVVLDRGYTGHEHLQSVGLINMNGRLYDPKLHRFLQPDNNIQDPNNTQNYNRYGYVLNNPLKYTDPSGEFGVLAAIGIGAFIAAATYTFTALLADVPFTIGGLVGATFMGAFSGAVTFGIGQAALTIKPLVSRFVFQALAHGTFQGVMSGVQGGNFWQGFASGALASIASSLYSGGSMAKGGSWNGFGGEFAQKGVGIITFGTIAGGAGAALTGGNFWQGAATGLIVSGLNHAVHGGFAKKYKLHVLEDYEAANGAGHQALVGDVDGDLLYVSKDGTNENNGVYGEAKNTIRRFDSFEDIDEFYSTRVSPGKHYDSRLTFKVTKTQMQTALKTAIRLAVMPYNLINNSCTTIVQFALNSAGILNFKDYSTIPNQSYKTMSQLKYKPAY
jgi:RHS repeat-associated protein